LELLVVGEEGPVELGGHLFVIECVESAVEPIEELHLEFLYFVVHVAEVDRLDALLLRADELVVKVDGGST